jgi:hypothetical protein
MRVLGLALVSVLAITPPMAAKASGPAANLRPASVTSPSNIVFVWDGGGSGGHARAMSGQPTASRSRQWSASRGPNGRPFGWRPYGWQGVPTYWVWGPSGGAFDYPFAAEWRGPTGGWGNP